MKVSEIKKKRMIMIFFKLYFTNKNISIGMQLIEVDYVKIKQTFIYINNIAHWRRSGNLNI